jgi:hypothetical protein
VSATGHAGSIPVARSAFFQLIDLLRVLVRLRECRVHDRRLRGLHRLRLLVPVVDAEKLADVVDVVILAPQSVDNIHPLFEVFVTLVMLKFLDTEHAELLSRLP